MNTLSLKSNVVQPGTERKGFAGPIIVDILKGSGKEITLPEVDDNETPPVEDNSALMTLGVIVILAVAIGAFFIYKNRK